ncbi:MAG: PepSY domain-containing protein [Corticimicrobacter sp.]|uniref:PepSY domain-containing protein n=1 Tax=Corticimicrobacter sp. TaxID=2678536 RepID=UPI0032DB28AD
MKIRTRLVQLTYALHRWTGIAGCLLMLCWFISGITMLYVGYPKLTPWERLGALSALNADQEYRPITALPSYTPGAPFILTSIGNQPIYITAPQAGTSRSRNAHDAKEIDAQAPATALAAAQAYLPDTPMRYDTLIQEDRWTHSRSLDKHRPLHRIDTQSPNAGLLYVSSSTAQVVLDAPQAQQYWNYVGAWMHWLYPFRNHSTDPVWNWTMILLSGIGLLSSVSGIVVGIWRWRFSRPYRSGSHSPYRQGWMRWHHIIGLLFGAIVCTWIFSGLMAMNPAGVVFSNTVKPDLQAYQGPTAPIDPALSNPAAILARLQEQAFYAVELQWSRLDGMDHVVAYDAQAHTRLVMADPGGLSIRTTWPDQKVLQAARKLLPWPLAEHRILTRFDAYYYQRHPEAMNGAAIQHLPALRLDFEDPARTRIYIDLQTGEVSAVLTQAQRTWRWLFYFLHSWDTPELLAYHHTRNIVLILLSIGGIIVSLSGIVIGWRHLRHQPS